jgi:flagellar biosynthesis GTPase FlhF
MTRYTRAPAYFLCFEDDPEAAAAAKKAEEEAAAKKAAEDKKNADEKQFSQADLNRFLADEKRKEQEKQRKLANELDEMRKQKNLTTQQKDELKTRIEELQTQFMTEEEKARQNAERQQKEYANKLKETEEERDAWKKKHTRLAINTEIASASLKHGAIDYDQIEAIVSPKTKLVEVLDGDGQLTGETIPKVSFEDVDKDKKPIVLELTVDEAVGRMRELPKHKNLFQSQKRGGLGAGGSATPGKEVDMAKLARTDQAGYREARKKRLAK